MFVETGAPCIRPTTEELGEGKQMTTDSTKVNADSLDGGDSIQTTLGELWELLGKGRHQAWPECVALQHGRWRYNGSPMRPQHTLAIVRDHIEGWLVGMGWNIISPGVTLLREYEHSGYNTEYISLIDAVRYALNHPPHDGHRPGN